METGKNSDQQQAFWGFNSCQRKKSCLHKLLCSPKIEMHYVHNLNK